ncbi:MAG: tRNA (adenosine(37)-N6)-threonylcarbamoyltransferase complex transferase subunit TsaD [bacterium]|nr:tRNA (adenosine(37)-N6)-threonylcarbamoyltransferase complex transferase subunit TsaD [bacterium]
MVILGIETSCDETAVAVIEMSPLKRSVQAADIKILSNVVLSQVPIHRKFGGVVPNLAKREHQKNLVPVLKSALKEAKLFHAKKQKTEQKFSSLQIRILHEIFEREAELIKRFLKEIPKIVPPQIDALAVTVGPGLEPALWAGVNFARALSYIWNKPVTPVNHLEGHVYTVMLGETQIQKHGFHLRTMKLPTLALIVSGGHTELVLMKKFGNYKIIGETRDDAAGEAFDKVAKMMKLGYPGGPIVSRLAENVKQNKKIKIKLPRPMINSGDFDFSFSGLKTATLYLLRDLEKKYSLAELRPLIAKEFQDAVVEVLVVKTIRAAKKYRVKSVILGGGVAANTKLRETLVAAVKNNIPNLELYLPSRHLTGDNALMIALAGYFSGDKTPWKKVRAEANLRLSWQ